MVCLKITVIYNPTSGKGIKKDILKRVEEVFVKNGHEVNFMKTEYPKHAVEMMKTLKDTDLVISMGGDGTFSEVTRGNLTRKKPLILAHIPIGTTNDVGAMYGYGKDIIKNIEDLLKGAIVEIDICYLNDTPFIYSAGFGKFIRVSYDTPRKLKKKYGYLAYLVEGLKEFHGKTKLYDFEVEVGGEKILGRYSLILVSNANRIAGIDHFYKNVKLNDQQFEVLLCNISNKKDIIKGLIALATKKIDKVSGFEFYKTSKLTLTPLSNRELPFSLDGEKFVVESDKICFMPKRTMKIMIPKKNVESLMVQ